MAETAGWEGALELARDRRVRVGLWLTALGGSGFGVVNTMAPITLAGFGLTALQTSAVFLAMAACGAFTSPRIGRQLDRRGRAPVTLVLLGIAVVTVTVTGYAPSLGMLVVVLVAAATCLEALYVPGGTLVMDGTAAADIAGGEIFALGNMLWASGMALASILAGVTASVIGQPTPYVLVAVAALGTMPFVLRLRRGVSAVAP
jgi:MFS family permease